MGMHGLLRFLELLAMHGLSNIDPKHPLIADARGQALGDPHPTASSVYARCRGGPRFG